MLSSFVSTSFFIFVVKMWQFLQKKVYRYSSNLWAITLEDNTKQPLTANASLYNGQPTDTGSSCPSARLTSCTPSISKNKGGVSVENVPSENKQWFVLRVSYGRVLKAKDFVEAKGFECYVPMRYKEVKKHDKKRIITEPLLPSFLFVHVTAEQVETLIHDNKVVINERRAGSSDKLRGLSI